MNGMGRMSELDDVVSFEITISRKALKKAKIMAKDPYGPAGDLAGDITPEDLISQLVEIYFEE